MQAYFFRVPKHTWVPCPEALQAQRPFTIAQERRLKIVPLRTNCVSSSWTGLLMLQRSEIPASPYARLPWAPPLLSTKFTRRSLASKTLDPFDATEN
jgi:hypothetical protein